MDVPAGSEPLALRPGERGYLAQLWKGELQRAKDAFDKWEGDAKKVEERYALEGDKTRRGTRINLLWSNVETLAPALYAKPPKMVASRRFLDKDPIGRVACRIIQRAVQYQIDGGEIHASAKRAVLDRLLVGRGQIWCRYDPKIEGDEDGAQDDAEPGEGASSGGGDPGAEPAPVGGGDLPDADDDAGAPGGDAGQAARITAEVVHPEYVHWKDFRHDPARTWTETRWVARRSYLTKDELTRRFGAKVAEMVPLVCGPAGEKDGRNADDDRTRKAEVWEIWDRDSRSVVWVATDCEVHLDRRDDPYGLEDFFPCPEPLYATLTNGSLVPTPDFHQYEDQAEQLDDIAERERGMTKAMRVVGGYDSEMAELARILKADDLTMLPIDDMMSKFAAGGGQGLSNALAFLPLDVFGKGLEALAKRKAEVKADAYEITGMSDILRGQGDAGETATGVQTKGHFATLRLKADQAEVARFVRDVVRIMAEMTCELFQPETLAEMASVYEMDELQVPAPMPPPMPSLAPPGGVMGMRGQGAPQMGGNVPQLPPPVPPLQPQRLPMMAGPMAGQGRP